MTDSRHDAIPERSPPPEVDADALAARLRAVVDGWVRFDAKFRGLYATDASNYRQVPIGVVVPRSKEDVVRAVAVCREFGAPILGRGGGTSLAGQCCNVAVVFDFTKFMGEIVDLDPGARTANVEPGCVLDHLRTAAEAHGLTFGPDPATHNRCTLGGMIGNNSCGVHSQMSGRTSDYVIELEILTYEGERFWVGPADDAEFDAIIGNGGRRAEIYQALRDLRDDVADDVRREYPDIPRRVSGYNLDDLLTERCNIAKALVGSESTCVIVLEARLRLIPSPKKRSLLLVGWPDIETAGDRVPEIVKASRPIGLEAFDQNLVDYMVKKGMHGPQMRLLPKGGGWMMIEFGGDTQDEADLQARDLEAYLKEMAAPPDMVFFNKEKEMGAIWALRESGLGATARVPGHSDTWPGWEDAAVPPERLGDYLRDFKALLQEFDYHASLYGHFGQGCIHTRIPFELHHAEGIAHYKRFVERAADLVVSYGGSISGEHGDGQARAGLLERMYGPNVMAGMRRFKSIWDPLGRMNPGKVVDPYPIDANLRLGADYAPWEPETVFGFPEDEGRFSAAVLRCVGVGLCRRDTGGTMCPSYMVTHDEEHSTRGRARLLFEMLQGDVVRDGWRSEEVKESLELCISCKGCLVDCPVDVDMASYKAEFLHHHYKHKRRPRHAYAFGLIDIWARWGARMPRLTNAVTQGPLAGLSKRIAGMASERQVPRFADETFRAWFDRTRNERTVGGDAGRVVFWPDTFTNHFDPHIPKAAVTVLEAAGYQVVLPPKGLCCGRPLYDYGMLTRAKRLLGNAIEGLKGEIRAGVPMVGVEPSCVATFRDELVDLFDDEDAKRLARSTRTFAEFLDERPEALQRLGLPIDAPECVDAEELGDPPALMVQRHCHHHAVMGHDPDRRMLDRLGVPYEVLESGCCGLAGSFGFEAEHYGVSMKIGERVLLPRVRAAPDARLVADGFSCRTQVHQSTGRSGLHLAELLAERIKTNGGGKPSVVGPRKGNPSSKEVER